MPQPEAPIASTEPTLLGQTCDDATRVAATLAYMLERATSLTLRDSDLGALRRADRELARVRERIAASLTAHAETLDAETLRLRDDEIPRPADTADADGPEELCAANASSDAYEILESWRLTGRDDAMLRSAVVDDATEPAADEAEADDRSGADSDRPETAEDLLAALLDAKGHSHSMHGTTESMPLATVVQFLSKANRTGRLEVRCPDETLTFGIVTGKLGFTATNRPNRGARLGEQLVQLGALEAQQLEAVLETLDPAREPLAAALESQKLVTRDQIRAALNEQARQRMLRALDAPVAAYAFYPGPGPEDDRMRLTVLELLLESCRRQDERDRQPS